MYLASYGDMPRNESVIALRVMQHNLVAGGNNIRQHCTLHLSNIVELYSYSSQNGTDAIFQWTKRAEIQHCIFATVIRCQTSGVHIQ